MKNNEPKKILLTAARSPLTLDLARKLKAAGHQVYVAETSKLHLCKFSRAVTKSFVVPSPRFNSKGFIDALVEIVEKEKIDLLIPIYEEIFYLSKERHRFPSHCHFFAHDFDTLNKLHNKWLFFTTLQSMGIDAPKSVLIKSKEDLKNIPFTSYYALKPSYSRASLHVKKMGPHSPIPDITIEPKNPWVAQEWLQGDKFCTYSICHEGELVAHAVYPVKFAIDGNSCITFQAVEHKPIMEWIQKFVKAINFTGQIAFDLVQVADGRIMPIECNPRATSGLHLFKSEDRLDKAFLNITSKPIFPKIGRSRQLAMGMLIYGWKKTSLPANNNFGSFLKTFLTVKDVVFSPKDINPFLSQPLIFAGFWLNTKKHKQPIPAALTFENEWNGE